MLSLTNYFLRIDVKWKKNSKFSKGRKEASPNLKKILKNKRMGLMKNFLKLLMGPTLPHKVYFNVHIVPRLASDQRT